MKKFLIATSMIFTTNVCLAVSESGTGTPSPLEDGGTSLPVLLHWILSFWPL